MRRRSREPADLTRAETACWVMPSWREAAGRTVVVVDDEYARAARAGLPVESPLAGAAR